MTASRHESPSYAAVRGAADRALNAPQGVTVYFRIADHGTMAQCEHLARGFQVSFTSMRARARRLSAKIRGENPHMMDSMATGEYDRLVCQRALLPDGGGWSVGLYPTAMMLAGMEIVDNATGQPITDIGKGQTEAEALSERILRALIDKQRPTRPTPEDMKRLWELAPDNAAFLTTTFNLTRPPDIATMDLDELAGFGVEEEDGTGPSVEDHT